MRSAYVGRYHEHRGRGPRGPRKEHRHRSSAGRHGSLPKGKLEAIRENCKRNSKPFEYAFLLDALKNEQSQGITIDTCRCFFQTEKRRYIIIDAPGHIEFLKNMVTGASRAEAALMVIDRAHGVEENTRRHGYYLSMLGIKQVAVLVNKMDLIDYDQARYAQIRAEYTASWRRSASSPRPSSLFPPRWATTSPSTPTGWSGTTG